jgi:hypothetical protein
MPTLCIDNAKYDILQAIWCKFEMLWSRFRVGICSIENPMQGIANTGITTHLIKFKKKNKVITHRTIYSTLSSSTWVNVMDHWLYHTTISFGHTPLSRTEKTLGTPRCMDRCRPTLTWSPSRFSAHSILLLGVDTWRMICQYSACW